MVLGEEGATQLLRTSSLSGREPCVDTSTSGPQLLKSGVMRWSRQTSRWNLFRTCTTPWGTCEMWRVGLNSGVYLWHVAKDCPCLLRPPGLSQCQLSHHFATRPHPEKVDSSHLVVHPIAHANCDSNRKVNSLTSLQVSRPIPLYPRRLGQGLPRSLSIKATKSWLSTERV